MRQDENEAPNLTLSCSLPSLGCMLIFWTNSNFGDSISNIYIYIYEEKKKIQPKILFVGHAPNPTFNSKGDSAPDLKEQIDPYDE